MHAERWQRIERLCQAALEREPGEQPAFLDEVCAGDEALRREVESLLAQQKKAEKFLEAPAMEVAAKKLAEEVDRSEKARRENRLLGRRISHYRIVEKLASGGMGEVYRAVRADEQYEKQVAIKLVRAGLETEYILERFRTERQVLAGLEHPNIARLLDAGTTEEGVPYYVMECIEGQPIDEYCDSRRLPIVERLRLFRAVCSAVHYAHQRLVVHRDIKPANILVTAEGAPKLLDFGIAKILHPESSLEFGVPTVTAFQIMTPEYASPEQVRGEPITTATDVYSLGVVLYQLLTGHFPYRLSSRSPHEVARAICDTEPEKPSTVIRRVEAAPGAGAEASKLTPEIVSGARGTQPERLRRHLSGDLDHIVLKAMRKEPQLRYASAEQFSEDIERYLQGRPVAARARTWRYRSVKFIRRNKTGVVAAMLVILALAAGMVTTIQQRRRAERRFNDVRALANSLLFEVHDSIKNLAGATPARKLLVSKALVYLDSLSQEAAGDESLQRELAAAYEKVGDVQGYPYAANLGDPAGALASYRKALAIRESVAARDHGSEESRRDLANDYQRIGMALTNVGDFRGALESYRKDLAIEEVLEKAKPTAMTQERLAGAYFLIARCYGDLQDVNAALDNYRKSAAIRESIAGSSPAVRSRLAGAYGYMATILATQGNVSHAIALQRKSLEIMTKLSEDAPTNAGYRQHRDEAYYWLGFFLEWEGDTSQALLNYRLALADFDALASADPEEVLAKECVGMCYTGIGTAMAAGGDPVRGLQSVRKGLAIFEQLPDSEKTGNVAGAYRAIGFTYSRLAVQPGSSRPVRLADWKQARDAYQKSLDLWLDIKNQRGLTFFEADKLVRIRRELVECESALAKLTPPVH
jgi:serine/threonine protein kinase